ncbi:unnamed protein product, partial [marine sediment metagenome]
FGDLASRRGRIYKMETRDNSRYLSGYVPLAELFRYITKLRSMTQGRGIPNIEFSHYEEVPSDVAEKIIGRGVMRGQTKNQD